MEKLNFGPRIILFVAQESCWKEMGKSWECNGRRVPVARPHSLLSALHAQQESPPHRSFSRPGGGSPVQNVLELESSSRVIPSDH